MRAAGVLLVHRARVAAHDHAPVERHDVTGGQADQAQRRPFGQERPGVLDRGTADPAVRLVGGAEVAVRAGHRLHGDADRHGGERRQGWPNGWRLASAAGGSCGAASGAANHGRWIARTVGHRAAPSTQDRTDASPALRHRQGRTSPTRPARCHRRADRRPSAATARLAVPHRRRRSSPPPPSASRRRSSQVTRAVGARAAGSARRRAGSTARAPPAARRCRPGRVDAYEGEAGHRAGQCQAPWPAGRRRCAPTPARSRISGQQRATVSPVGGCANTSAAPGATRATFGPAE